MGATNWPKGWSPVKESLPPVLSHDQYVAATALLDELVWLADTAVTHGHLYSWQQERRRIVAAIKEQP